MGMINSIRDLLGRPKAAQPTTFSPRSEFMRGNRGVVMKGWRPALRDSEDDVGASWDAATARALDVIQNSGWIAGGVDQAVANTVGTGLRLKAMPENKLFGMSDADARNWSLDVERRFGLWANKAIECDIEGRRSFGQMQAALFRSWLATGELWSEYVWRRRPGAAYGTKVRLIQSHRVSRKNDQYRNIVQGVRMDRDGFPVAYLAKRKDPLVGEVDYEVIARDTTGRPRVLHVFDGMPGQVRGITPLVPALQIARQFDQLADATLTAAIIQTVFAATIKSDEPTEDVLQGMLTAQEHAKLMSEGKTIWDAWFDAQAGFYENSTINVGINGRIAHLFPGQEMNFHSAQHPNSNYKDFALHLLREVFRCLGITYESGTGDYTGATYASMRMAVHEIFQITLYRRQHIVSPFCQSGYEAWLEEDIETGGTPFPGGIQNFLANRTAACRALWRGTPKPQADDLKAAKAHETYSRIGVVSDAMIAEDLGTDIEDVYAQRASEKALREQYDLPDAAHQGVTTPPADESEPEEEDA